MDNYIDKINMVITNAINQAISMLDLSTPLKILIFFIDMIAVLCIIYYLYKLVKDTRAKQIFKGIAIFIGVTVLSGWLQLTILNYILKTIMTYGVLLIIVVFQPELRKALEKIGRGKLGDLIYRDINENKYVVNEVAKAIEYLSTNKIGALIVFEKETKIDDITREGIEINAKISSELIINIFIPNTPLHDGAVVIRNNNIKAASCVLPLSSEEFSDKSLGTRHRAAIGITEVSDSIAVVVSEETSKISIVQDGKITKDLSISDLRQKLNSKLMQKRI